MFSDLECDFINPIDLCNKLNNFVMPEVGVHLALTVIFLLSFQVWAFLMNVPLVAYNLWKINSKKHTFDATGIMSIALMFQV